jgi:hypothetical protein
VQDASILWSESPQGFDPAKALRESLPSLHSMISNDVSAAAWC